MAEPALEKAREAPSFKIFVGGSELPPETAVDILDVLVSDYVEGSGAFTVTMNNWHSEKQEFKWIDADLMAEGSDVEIKVGYVDNLKSLITGEVTALEPEYHDTEAPTLKVSGYDSLHRFRRGRKTRSFAKMKDSQIAEQVAKGLNLKVQVDDSQIVHEYMLQNNQTDIDFLLERARRINYEIIIKDSTLCFRKAATNKSQAISLDFGLTLKTFYPRLSTMQQVSEVIVQGWNPMTKKAVKGQARSADVTSKMNGSNLGVTISEKAFFATKTFIIDKPICSDGEANQIAKGKFNEMAIQFIKGEGVAVGNTDIRAGSVVELKGLGKRFSGLYYVTSSTHSINNSGYTTRFTVSRNAA